MESEMLAIDQVFRTVQLIESIDECAGDARTFASVTRRIQVWGKKA
jgi:hypothetical protein